MSDCKLRVLLSLTPYAHGRDEIRNKLEVSKYPNDENGEFLAAVFPLLFAPRWVRSAFSAQGAAIYKPPWLRGFQITSKGGGDQSSVLGESARELPGSDLA
jgi:hypothetical protein